MQPIPDQSTPPWRLVAILVTTLAASLPAPALADAGYDRMSVEQLDQELARTLVRGKQLRILARLRLIGEAIAERGRCQESFSNARDSKRRLVELNQQYEKRADHRYRQQEVQLRQVNQNAVNQYKVCFSEQIRVHHRWPEHHIVDYRSFSQLFINLAVELKGENEVDLNRQADALYAAKQRAVLAATNRGQTRRQGGPPTSSQDSDLRKASRSAVDRMLSALRDLDASALLASTTGAAQEDVRHSVARGGLDRLVRRSGRPSNWQTDCVACRADGFCEVPTVVNLMGKPAKRYEVVHLVRQASNGPHFVVDQIEPWNAVTQQRFQSHRPLCRSDFKQRRR